MLSWFIFVAMRAFFIILGATSILTTSAQPSDSIAVAVPVEYNGIMNTDLGLEKNAERMKKAFELSFGAHSGTNVEGQSTDSLLARSQINFEQKILVNRDATRGPISFKIQLKATDDGVQYQLFDFNHTGNTSERMGPKSFGPITTASNSPKVPGTTSKSRNAIWQEIKYTLDENVKERLQQFELYMGRSL